MEECNKIYLEALFLIHLSEIGNRNNGLYKRKTG